MLINNLRPLFESTQRKLEILNFQILSYLIVIESKLPNIKSISEFCKANTTTNNFDGVEYYFGRAEAYTMAKAESPSCPSGMGGEMLRECEGGGKWSDHLIDNCRTKITSQNEAIRDNLDGLGEDVRILHAQKLLNYSCCKF